MKKQRRISNSTKKKSRNAIFSHRFRWNAISLICNKSTIRDGITPFASPFEQWWWLHRGKWGNDITKIKCRTLNIISLLIIFPIAMHCFTFRGFFHYYVYNSLVVIWFCLCFFFAFSLLLGCIEILCVGIYGFREKSHFNRYRQGNKIYVSFTRRMHMVNLIVEFSRKILLHIWAFELHSFLITSVFMRSFY